MSKAKDYRDMSAQELMALKDDKQKELFHFVNEYKLSKKLEKPHLIRQIKKDIARVLTVLTEKQSAAQQDLA
jgi:large subunit ribosomal protein L29